MRGESFRVGSARAGCPRQKPAMDGGMKSSDGQKRKTCGGRGLCGRARMRACTKRERRTRQSAFDKLTSPPPRRTITRPAPQSGQRRCFDAAPGLRRVFVEVPFLTRDPSRIANRRRGSPVPVTPMRRTCPRVLGGRGRCASSAARFPAARSEDTPQRARREIEAWPRKRPRRPGAGQRGDQRSSNVSHRVQSCCGGGGR